MLKFLSQKIASGKRRDDLLMLKQLIDSSAMGENGATIAFSRPRARFAVERGIGKSIIYRYLKSQGVSFEKHPRKPITDLDLEWKRLYLEERKSLSSIARMYGVSPTTVSKHLSKLGVEVQRDVRRNC